MVNEMSAWALHYQSKGVSIIPLGKNKKPLINSWKEFQERIATKEEVTKWWQDFPEANIGLITGKISNVSVVDVEKGGDISKLPKTSVVKTGGGGWHFYYQYEPNLGNSVRILPLTDIRSDGGYVVAPPSLHESGMRYKSYPGKMMPFPLHLFGGKREYVKKDWEELINGTSQGGRNDTAAQIVGKLVKSFPPDQWETTVWQLTKQWNQGNNPPLEENELRSVFQSIAGREILKPRENLEDIDIVHISQAINKKGYSEPTKIGYPLFEDVMKGGVREGELIIVTGRSGEGKTTFLQNITVNMSRDMIPCMWFSYEMIIDNLYAKFCDMALEKKYNIEDLSIFVPEKTTTGNLKWIKEQIIKAKDRLGVKFFFIDHIDFLSPTNTNSSDQHRIMLKNICTELKDMAKNLEITIFMVAHIKKVQGREIEMQDIAESSGIFQLADYIFSVQRTYIKENINETITNIVTDDSLIRMLKNRITGKMPFFKFRLINDIIIPTEKYLEIK